MFRTWYVGGFSSSQKNCVTLNHIFLKLLPGISTLQCNWGTNNRVAKFESKVGSRRTTKIGNLVVLDIFLVVLILIPYDKMAYACWKKKG